MSYVVNWRSGDGTDGWHAAADLTDAVVHVEHLRNREGVEGAKIFRLEEVAFELRPYFRVELASVTAAPPVVMPEAPAAEAPAAEALASAMPVHADESWAEAVWPATGTASVEAADPTLEPAADGGANGAHRRGLFGR